jgi:hypothetical protein
MFITKKKFNEALEKAMIEREKEIYLRDRFNRIEDDFYKRMNHLEKRVYKLENPGEKDKPDNGVSISPACY